MRHIWSDEDIVPGTNVIIHEALPTFIIASAVVSANRWANQFSPGDYGDRQKALLSLWTQENRDQQNMGVSGRALVLVTADRDSGLDTRFIGPFKKSRLAQWLTGMNARKV